MPRPRYHAFGPGIVVGLGCTAAGEGFSRLGQGFCDILDTLAASVYVY